MANRKIFINKTHWERLQKSALIYRTNCKHNIYLWGQNGLGKIEIPLTHHLSIMKIIVTDINNNNRQKV